MIQGAIFDMDGLMLDTERIGARAWAKAGQDLNVPITEAILGQIRGRSRKESQKVFERELGGCLDYNTAKSLRDCYGEEIIRKEGVPLKPGILELLRFLKQQNIATAVATSTLQDKAEQYLKEAGIYPYLDQHVYGNMVQNSKPNPEIFLKASQLLNLPPEDCMVMEDSISGVTAGKAAQMTTIMVPDLTLPNEELRQTADVICTSLYEVIDLVKKWNHI